MNILCIYFLFYIFLSGSILFTILGVFAGTGNPVVILENSQVDENNKLKEEEGIKKRVTIQYFIAAVLDLVFCFIFLKFIFNESKKDNKNELIQEKSDQILEKENTGNIINEEDKNTGEITTNSINNNENNSNNINNQGMSEKD